MKRVKLREECDIWIEGKELHSLKNIIRRDTTPITSMIDGIFHRDFNIDELKKKTIFLVVMSIMTIDMIYFFCSLVIL